MRRLYDIGILLMGLGLTLARFFNTKAKQRYKHQNDWKSLLPGTPIDLWMHCASLGEFDQGLPLLWEYRKLHPENKILVTFFSPSGLNHYHKRNHCVDLACLLPLDCRKNAKEFIKMAQPTLVVFVKYEFWLNFIFRLKKGGYPVYCVAALFRKKQIYFRPMGSLFRKGLRCFEHFFVQDENSKNLLLSIGIENVSVSGDPRYDCVLAQKNQVRTFSSHDKDLGRLQKACASQTVMILGSSWLAEEELLFKVYQQLPVDRFIIAPHNISEGHLYEIEAMFGDACIRLSEISKFRNEKFFLIDCIGVLNRIYGLSTVAFIGGGFSGKLHNILEPAAYGVPVVFGPKHDKFPEANAFISEGIGFEIEDSNDLAEKVRLILKDIEKIKQKTLSFVAAHCGATERTATELFNKRGHSDTPSN